MHTFFFEMEDEISGPYFEEAHTGLYLDFVQQRLFKSIHHKTQNHHSTPTNLSMGEEHVIMALCPKNKNNTPPAKYWGHHRDPAAETRAFIRSSRPSARTSFTPFRSPPSTIGSSSGQTSETPLHHAAETHRR
jgi:hypothetical protein